MKLRHYLITGVGVYLCSLIYLAPAETILNFLLKDNTSLSLTDIDGSLWNGSAKNAHFKKHQLDDLSWSFSLRQLLSAELGFNVNASYKNKPVSTVIGTSLTSRITLHDFTAAIDAYTFGQLIDLPVGELSGDIDINILDAYWSPGGVPAIKGTASWKQSAITIAEKAALGDVTINLDESDDSPLTATITNTPADLLINGTAITSNEGKYEIDITLKSTDKTSRNLRNSLKMVSKQQADGSYKIINKGDLSQLGLM